jgi:renalase
VRVAVVGAGVAGLAAARTLADAGHECVVFEASDRVGGRVRTDRVGGYVFDSGATSVAPRGLRIAGALPSVAGIVRVARPVYVLDGHRAVPSSHQPAGDRFASTLGLDALPNSLATGLDVRLDQKVERIEAPMDGGYALQGEMFEAAVVAIPVPAAQALLATARDSRRFAGARYRPCLSVLLGYQAPLETPYHALIDTEQSRPLTWLSVETMKCEGRAPEGCTALVAQMNAPYSQRKMGSTDASIVSDVLVDIGRILGPAFTQPEVSQVVRWELSQPETTVSPDSSNSNGSRLVVCGDGFLGGRIELAYQSGVSVAERLVEALA